jgi:hypothetical protein
MKIRTKDTLEIKLVYPEGSAVPLKPLNAKAGNAIRLTEHVHVDGKLRERHENWRIPLGAEVEMTDAHAQDLIDTGHAEAI